MNSNMFYHLQLRISFFWSQVQMQSWRPVLGVGEEDALVGLMRRSPKLKPD